MSLRIAHPVQFQWLWVTLSVAGMFLEKVISNTQTILHSMFQESQQGYKQIQHLSHKQQRAKYWRIVYLYTCKYSPAYMLNAFYLSVQKNLKVNCCFHPTKRMLSVKIVFKCILMNIKSEYRSKFNVYFVCFLKNQFRDVKNNQYVSNIIQLLSLLLSILSCVTIRRKTLNNQLIN